MSSGDPDRPDQTLADYVGIALAPALVMTLVGSLVFFLLEICYHGDYVARMRWTLFFFVFGIVLVCRISMLPDISDRSWLYGLFLAGGTWLCLQGFVEYPYGSLTRELSPLINLALIGIVWWSSGKLVRDCTNVDEDTDMSGQGLLQASGLDGVAEETASEATETEEKTTATGLMAWWERYQSYRRKADRKRTLGVWIIYYSLAALPLFGLGQTLIPAADVERRQKSFWLLTLYVASGLGLLMVTCFLGLRRYLRQRRLKMPAAMTGVWLTCGLILIVVLLVLGAVLPRPQAEYSWIDFERLTGGEKSASQYAQKGDSPGKGDGKAGEASKDAKTSDKSGDGKGDQGKGKEKAEGKASGDKKGKGEAGQGKGEGQKGSGEQKGQGGDSGKDGKGGQAKKDERSRQEQSRDGKQEKDSNVSRKDSSSIMQPIPKNIANVLKWIVFAIVGLVTLCVIGYAILRFLANFTPWAANFLKFWSRLFTRRPGKRRREEEAVATLALAPPPRPFSSFHNPYRLGQRWTPYEFCCYTFTAFEAWARERGVARLQGETPLEHAERVGGEIPAVETEVRRLALIYARGVYGSDDLPPAVNDVLRQTWEMMESGTNRPVAVSNT
jgi:hypothetical protein